MSSHDVRRNGVFLARYPDEKAAQKGAEAMDLDGVTVEPSKPFELHCEQGFLDAFSTQAEAHEASQHPKYSRFKTFSVKNSAAEIDEEISLGNDESDSAPESVLASEAVTEPAPPELDA